MCNIFRVGYAKISRRKPSFQWNMGLSEKSWIKKKGEKIGFKFTFFLIQVGWVSILNHQVDNNQGFKLIYYMGMYDP